MKRLLTQLSALVCVGALAIPSPALAEEVKERATFTYGDAMGTASTEVWTTYVHNFYDKEGKVVRTATLFRANTGDINLQKKAEWNYNEAGQPTESLQYTAYATSQDNVDKEYAFNLTGKTVWEYDANGRLSSTYTMQYRATTGAWVENKNSCYEYTYDDNGVLTSGKYWLSKTSKNEASPTQTLTYECDANGRVTVEKHVGAYYSSTYDREYSYDTQGRVTHAINTCTLESSAANYNKPLLEETWIYEGDFLKEYRTDSYYNASSGTTVTTKRTCYEMVDNDPQNYYAYSETYKSATDEWTRSKNFSGYLNQDYEGMAQLVPELSVTTTSSDASVGVTISFTLPTISYDNYAVRIYRDGAELKTLSKTELTEIKNGDTYSFTDDSNLTSGEHEYFAQVLVADAGQEITADSELDQEIKGYKEGFISNIATAQVVIPYPEITDFHIKGYTLTRTWVPEQVDEEDPELTVPAYWRENYKLYFEWTPLTEEQVEGYNFERYDIFFKSSSGNASMASISDISTGEASVDWFERYTEVWLEIKYGEDHIATEHITINLDQLTNLNPSEPLPVYGVEYYGGWTPAFVKADLSKPEETAEVIYNLYYDSYADMYSIFGGVTVGDSYYALYEDEYGDIYLGAFDMANKNFVQIGDAYMEESFSDLLYDEASDKLYAVAPAGNASYLYTIDRTSGAASKTSIALPSYTLYLAAAEAGEAYAMAAETGKFQLYSVDLGTGTCSKIEGVTVEGTQNTWSSLLYYNDALYFNLGTSLYTIDPANKSVLPNTPLNRALSGITTVQSTSLPKNTSVGGKDSHIITTERSDAGTTNYYYSYWNQLERVAEFDADGNLTKYTKNTIDDALRLASTEVYEPSVDEYGIQTMQVTATSTYTYTYNEDGLLAEKSNSDGTWERCQYNEDGIVAKESFGNGETTERTVEYQYMQYPDKPTYAFTTTGSDETLSDIAMFQYDDLGNKIVEAHTADMMSGMYTSFETWEYFTGTGIVSAHNICVPNEFTANGDPVVGSSTKYQALDGDYNHLLSQDFDSEGNPVDGTEKELVYADLSNTAELAYLTASATAVEESANNVAIGFTIPQLAYTSDFSLDFFRDGVQVGQLSSDEIAEMNEGNYAFTDKQVPNGKHEYFIRTNRVGSDGEEAALQISEIVDVTLDKTLPTVSDIAYVKYETAEAEDATATDEPNYIVTIGWTNPEVSEDYGFTGNHLFLIDSEEPVAAGVFTDLQTAEAKINVGNATSFTVMIQSRYALGVANSDSAKLSFEVSDGVDDIYGNGFSLRIEDKSAIASEDAVISVFRTDGVRVASTYGNRLDLSALTAGTYVVTAEKAGSIRVVKVIL